MTDRNRLVCLMSKIVPLPFSTIGKIADHLTENGVTFARDTNVPNWIPVTERLPEYGQEVLVYAGNILKPLVYGTVYWNKDYQNWVRITHWMPLPEPPNIKNSKEEK